MAAWSTSCGPDISARWKEIHCRHHSDERLEDDADQFHRADGSVVLIRWKIEPWRDGESKVGGVVLLAEILKRQIPKTVQQQPTSNR